MSDDWSNLRRPPIVEAVIDFDCDMPPAMENSTLESNARAVFIDQYPKARTQFLDEYQVEIQSDGSPKSSARHDVHAFQFLQEDQKQLVQIRMNGFSFNRLTPYTSLDDYLPEIERTWRLFTKIASPIQVRAIRLRYINRILLPLVDGQLELNDYFLIAPRLPDEATLQFETFFNQHAAVERGSGNRVNIVLTNQQHDQRVLPIIFDITASRDEPGEPDNWSWILDRITSLRHLKNRVFRRTITDKCLQLFN